MKRLILVMMCVLLYAMPVNATEFDGEVTNETTPEEVVEETEEAGGDEAAEDVGESVEEQTQESAPQTSEQAQEETSVAETVVEGTVVQESAEEPVVTETIVTVEVIIPDVTGMTETDAVAALGAVVLSDGSAIEVIKEYKYTNDAKKDVVFEQSISGAVSEEEAKQVRIVISMGADPAIKQNVVSMSVNPTVGSMFPEVDWNEVPIVYEYNYDNSDACWNTGMWLHSPDGDICFKSPQGTYNNDVRHIIQLYYDENFVYVHAIMATCYGQDVNGNDYMFYFDGQETKFKLLSPNGNDLSNENWSAGTYPLTIKHENYIPSGTTVIGGEAYCTVFENGLNTDVQLKIPLSEFKRQNENVNLDSIGELQFFTHNLMYNRLTAAGASTFPLATAAAALILVPGTAFVINKKRKTLKKDSNE